MLNSWEYLLHLITAQSRKRRNPLILSNMFLSVHLAVVLVSGLDLLGIVIITSMIGVGVGGLITYFFFDTPPPPPTSSFKEPYKPYGLIEPTQELKVKCPYINLGVVYDPRQMKCAVNPYSKCKDCNEY